ncbi:hypothetical protein B296_00022436, partial [Ensete ventricosum]
TGSELLVYDVESGKLINTFQVFEGVRVHGISLRYPDTKEDFFSSEADYLVAVFGERRLKLFLLRVDVGLSDRAGGELCVRLDLVQRLPGFDHWILDACFLKVFPGGRGIWRCLYDPDSSLLVSAGFDSTIKVHQLYSSSSTGTREQGGLVDDPKDQREIFEICAPKLTKQLGLMDSLDADHTSTMLKYKRYSPIEMGGWSKSILLGEHVGGSAVRFDVALLVPTKSPILSLQHIVVT